MWLGNYVMTKQKYLIKISPSKFELFREKNDVLTFIWPSFFPEISVIFYTAFIILHDKHNKEVMPQVKRLILPIKNESWHTIRYDSICYVNFLLPHLNIWVHP